MVYVGTPDGKNFQSISARGVGSNNNNDFTGDFTNEKVFAPAASPVINVNSSEEIRSPCGPMYSRFLSSIQRLNAMKASDKPEISKKWWMKEKPADIKGTDLEKALADCEKALAELQEERGRRHDQGGPGSARSDLSGAVDKTIKKECDKKKHKDLITVLEKYDDLIADEDEGLGEGPG